MSFWGTFLTVLALPSALLTILGAHWSGELTIALVAAALAFAFLVHRRELANVPMPSALELVLNGHTSLHCPCDDRVADEAKLIASRSYPPGGISPQIFEQLRLKNPQILASLTDTHGTVLGYFDILPLKKSFAELFIRGAVTEDQITHDDVLAPNELKSCKFLFISGLAVNDPDSQAGRVAASILVWAMIEYINYFYGTTRPFVFAIASTSAGDEILRRFRFGVACSSDRRLDGYTLYGLRLTQDAVQNRLECVPDWSPTCSLPWRDTEGAARAPRRRRARPPRRSVNDLGAPLSPKPA